jgi:flagellar protein FlgJ
MADLSIASPQGPVDLLDPRQIAGLRRAAADQSPAALKAVGQQFEAILLTQMLQQMHKPMFPGGMFDGPESKSWNDMADQRMGEMLAKSGGIGIADALLRQIETSRALAGGAQGGTPAAVNKV